MLLILTKNDPFFYFAAPCAPVINPQAPNAATGTSLRVCWGLFSDDTVECYQLCYKPVSNERHSDEQAGKGNWETRGQLSPADKTGSKVLLDFAVATSAPSIATLPATNMCATIALASGFVTLLLQGLPCCQLQQDPSQKQRQDWGSSWDHRNGKGAEDSARSQQKLWGVGTAFKHTCTTSTAKHCIFRKQIIILSACLLKPPQSFYSLSQC